MTTDEVGVEVRGPGGRPVLERCTSLGLREVVGEEEGGRGTEGQRRKDMERKRLTGSNKKKNNSALPLFQTCGGDSEAGAQTGMR